MNNRFYFQLCLFILTIMWFCIIVTGTYKTLPVYQSFGITIIIFFVNLFNLLSNKEGDINVKNRFNWWSKR